MASTKRKRVSKKLKSAWRKHANVADVEDFLEEKRSEERLGELTTVPDEALFRIDSQVSKDIPVLRNRKKLAAAKELKCFSALRPYTNVPDPVTKRNRVRTKEERQSVFVRNKKSAKTSKLVKQTGKPLSKKKEPKRGEFNTNLWEEGNVNNPSTDEWVDSNTVKHNSNEVRKTRQSNKHKSPAIELPHPGMSYNPSYEDHQDLLRQVAEKEEKLIKEEEHLHRVTRGMFSKVTEEQRDQNWLLDMSQGLANTKSPQEEEEDESDEQDGVTNRSVKNNKKTLKQRRKKKEHLEAEKLRRQLKLQKKKITDIHNLKKIMNNIATVETKQTIRNKITQKKKEEKKKKTKTLSATKFEEPDLEFNLGREIAGNLRDLKTEGNLLNDRFKSMQKRNILAPTKRQTFKKPKVKKFTKATHKEGDWKKSVAKCFKD
ncbi:unnamed protein product [Phyllotreta striolata]|uniref:Ribosome biogenesis protein NOP53 n=1 Tax=Phyllotreta striolata TaxID=444603 RepID=A0A9N9XJI7_PHYSR|nr:unnamed protein product [Phyllotreta striolata]